MHTVVSDGGGWRLLSWVLEVIFLWKGEGLVGIRDKGQGVRGFIVVKLFPDKFIMSK